MRTFNLILVMSVFVYTSMFVGVAMAEDTGAGACAAGIGVSLNDNESVGPYVGFNAGTKSKTGAYDNEADFEAQCCAETGDAPDCFETVA